MTENQLRQCIKFALEHGYQIDEGAFKFLIEISKSTNPLELMQEVITKIENQEETFIISREILERLHKIEETRFEGEAKSIQPYAKNVEPKIEVLEDPTDKTKTSGRIKDYIQYFVNRFRKIEKILKSRSDFKDAVPLSQIRNSPPKSKVKAVCIITEKRERKNSIDLIAEDLKDEIRFTVTPNSDRELMEKARKLMLDQVIGIEAVKIGDNFLKVEDIVLPEVPNRKPRTSKEEIYAALISDLHVGSKEFMEEEFNKFLSWLNLEYGNDVSRDAAGKVKYLIIAGDLIDGVGVYPNQEKDLEIPDIYEQYREVAKLLSKVPEYIEIIVIPGNHDASRKALPQPSIPKEYAADLYEISNLHSLGNPAYIRIHGVEFLVYHGRSLDDVISSVPNMSFLAPEQAMKLLLQARHLAPIYGGKTPIAPGDKDHLVIERVPNVFHAGHVHVSKSCTYRGTFIVNSGTWQRQTEYQRMMGLYPTPGIVTLLNLRTFQTINLNFAG